MTRVVTGMANLGAPIALHNYGKTFLHACSHSKLTGSAPVLPLATERLCTPFGHIVQRKRLCSQTRHVVTTRSMVSNTVSDPQSKDGGSSWLRSSAVLASGGALPGLLLAWKWEQIADMGSMYQIISITTVDALFITTATAFLSMGSSFGTQQYGVFPKYPGPFKELDGSSFPPAYFKAYVTSLPLTFGIVIPVVALVYMLWERDTALAVCTLGAYLLEVVAQLVSEGSYIKQESVMWAQVPQVYQTYRIWQLIRGCYLTGAVGGHDWLWAMQAGLILLWVFNFGAVMTWTPWLYRWHLQAEDVQEGSAKFK